MVWVGLQKKELVKVEEGDPPSLGSKSIMVPYIQIKARGHIPLTQPLFLYPDKTLIENKVASR